MNGLLRDCLYPVMLGSNTLCHACVRQLQKKYGVGSTVLTGKRALTLRFLPAVKVVEAPPTLSDDLLCTVLWDISDSCGYSLPLLIICDERYASFVTRNKSDLEAHFILRRAGDLLGEGKT